MGLGRSFFAVCFLAFCPSFVVAQSDYELTLSGGTTALSESIEVYIDMRTAADAEGIRVAICYDPDEITLSNVLQSGYLDNLDAIVETIEEYDDGFTAVVVADTEGDGVLPATEGSESIYSFLCEPVELGTHALDFCDTLGDPAVSNAIVVDGEDIEPQLTGSEIQVLPSFLRGDCDGNGRVEPITDAFFLLDNLFNNPPCRDAADVDNNGSVFAIIDALYLLNWAFDRKDPPEAPGPYNCGVDPEGGDEGCDTPPECGEFEIPEIDDDFELSLVASDAYIGQSFEVDVRIDVDPDAADEIVGVQFSICHDDLLSLEGDESVTEPEDRDTTYEIIRVEDDGLTVGLLMNIITGTALPLEEDMILYTIEYDALSVGDSELTFCTLGSVEDDEYAISALVEIDFFDPSSVIPQVVDATISIQEPIFKRGDADGNGVVFSILDGLYILEWGFTNGPEPPCFDAADVDDDGKVFAILDAIVILGWGFNSGPTPPDPGPSECGEDPTDDDLTCDEVSDGCL